MPPNRPSSGWIIDPDLDEIDLDPSDFNSSLPLKKVPNGDVFQASRAGDVERLKYLLESGVNVNARDQWDSVALYYACLAGHLDAARMLLESGLFAPSTLSTATGVRKLLKAFEARPPPLAPLQAALRDTFLSCEANRYTDGLKDINPGQAEEMFDAASRYLLFPLKRAVADVLLPQLETVSPAELCHWLILSDMYGVIKIREYCLDTIACNFETFADTRDFRAMLLTVPPPSGDSSLRTTAPSAPGAALNTDQGNLLDDLREKWLEAEAADLDKRDESALLFDKRLEMLMLVARKESEAVVDDIQDSPA
ncbi:hypothetical protein NC653_033671 [Populus alba x Populus x berolinensis]|uniref:Ankyrin repeat family protein n=1 Tax=Populus alba x Populus x berolinensis TaxID=444605 RepID=A0AAD6LUG8_9ROSI|nr:hypothetical protein NC653_033671 [Populus alba x Populus x berolinensis]